MTIDSISKNKTSNRNKACINLIDLAGSEGIDKTKAEGIVRKEGDLINRSILSLGQVICALGKRRSERDFVVFRNSKLTKILEPSLTGGSKVRVICNINTSLDCLSQTLNTLRFAVSAGQVKLSVRSTNDFSPGQVSNIAENNEEAETLKQELFRASSELHDARDELTNL